MTAAAVPVSLPAPMTSQMLRCSGLAIMLAGCSSSSSTSPAPTPTPTIAVVSPTNVALGVVNTTISLTAHVQDSTTTRALAGVTVSWTIDQGRGSLQSATTTTDPSGNSSNVITLDKKIGPADVTAALSSGKNVKFTVGGVPGPAAAVQSTVTHLANVAAVIGGHTFTSINGSHGSEGSVVCGAGQTTYCWGINTFGTLGNGTESGANNPSRSNTPGPVMSEPGTVFSAVTAGGTHVCALDTNGHVWCWGNGSTGALGGASLGADHTIPSFVANPAGINALRVARRRR